MQRLFISRARQPASAVPRPTRRSGTSRVKTVTVGERLSVGLVRFDPMRRPNRSTQVIVTPRAIERRILLVRGEKVMLDSDLAALYGMPTKRLNQAVTRNAERFPPDFSFRLTPEEAATSTSTNLRSQIVTSSQGHGGRRTLPRAFTEA